MLAPASARHSTYADFASIVGRAPAWTIGGFPLRDGSVWEYREPEAISVVQNGRLRVFVPKLSRHHDRIQILDNAKHMLFSTNVFDVPHDGGVAFELDIRSRCANTEPGDLYDGFVSFNALELSQGAALDWFVGMDRVAPVFARLPFPGVAAQDARPLKYFAIFSELEHSTDTRRRVGIGYDRGADEVWWWIDGEEVWRCPVPIKLDRFVLALGIMTEKDLGNDGSVSCHGQAILGEWGPVEIATWGGREPGT